MAELIASRNITLNAANPRLQSPTVNLGKLTSLLSVSLRFPTTTQPLNWNASGKLRVTLAFIVDGAEYKCVGTVSGGIHKNQLGEDVPEYTLVYNPAVLFGEKALEYIKTAPTDAEGNYLDVPLTRLGETGTTVQGYLLLERISGTINTVVTVAGTVESEAPRLAKYHNSVAFDAATSGSEMAGDGVVTVSHTASGSNRAAFIAVGHTHNTASGNASATYGGSAATELWDAAFGTLYGNAAYSFVAPATSATNVVGTLTVTTGLDSQFVGVVTMTGVDQSTPTGTATHYLTDGAAGASRTPVGVATDDMVIDYMVGRPDTPVIGADQTQRATFDSSWPTAHRVSTQPGSVSPATMTWTFTGGFDYQPVYHGAVAFKAVAAATASLIRPRHPMTHLLVR